jgi:DnaJ-class molecular chaperone
MEVVEIPIPKGLPNGNTFTLRNYGEEGLMGAPSDFEITVVEIPTAEWSREGNNLVYLMAISLEESLFGFVRRFKHLDGSEVAVSREGVLTTKDTKHIIRERGIVNKQGYASNLIVKFKVTIPSFTDEQLDMWEDFFNEFPI